MKGNNIDWSKIDWSQPNDEIAKATGFSESTISYRRRGYHERKDRRTTYWIDWSGADWRKSNVALATYYSCTPQAAACARRIHAPAHLKISPSAMTRNKRMQAVIDERIARAEKNLRASEPKPESASGMSSILSSLARIVGFNLR